MKSRVNREVHARICASLGVKSPGATRPTLTQNPALRAIEIPGRMNWLRRESATGNTRAVWFDVLAAESAYFEGGCCLPDADGKNWVRLQAGYREEIAIDAGSGTILCRRR
jgi:hypothetical protein